ncbi:MAG: hypothetical protein JNL62_24780, partial [Bryobacterales bacterium]|nr:hypothetical protein [Bryobacterales bacterium]
WEGASGMLQFTNQFAQGVFNALTAHLEPENMVQYGAMGNHADPPLWLTVYSRGTNWPVAMLPARSKDTAETSLMAATCARLDPFLGPQHSGWVLLESVLIICTAVWVWFLYPSPKRSSFWEAAKEDWALSIPAILGGGALLALHSLFASAQWHYLSWAKAPSGPSIALGVTNLCAAVLLLKACIRMRNRIEKNRKWTLALLIGIFGVSIWISVLLPFMRYTESENFTAFFFVHRAYHLNSGVSPVLPVALFLGLVFLGATAQLLSRWIAYWLKVTVKKTAGEDEKSIDHWTSGECSRALVIAIAWTLLSIFLFRMGWVSTLEHPGYTFLFLFLFAVSVAFLSYAFLRLICLFLILRDMMRFAADKLPVDAIKKVAERKVWGVWRFHFWNMAVDKEGKETPDDVLRYAQASQTIIQMAQCQVFFLLAGILLGLFALQSYPFEPSRTFINYISFFFLLIGLGTFVIFGRIESAPFLTELYGTAGKSGLSFYWKTLSRFGLPLLAVLAAQFPDLGDLLVKILTPFLESGLD